MRSPPLSKHPLGKRFLQLLAPVAILLAVLVVVKGYTPPLLREGRGSVSEKAIDMVGFAWHHNRAFWYEASGNAEKVRHAYLMSGWYRPSFLEPILNGPFDLEDLANSYEQVNEFERAARLLLRSFDSLDSTPPNWQRLGELHLKAGNYAAAIQTYERAVQSNPSAHAYANLGRAFEKSNDAAQAEVWYRRAVEVDPSQFRALGGLERLLPQEEGRGLRELAQHHATEAVDVQNMLADNGHSVAGGWMLATRGALHSQVNLPEGRSKFTITARGTYAGDDWPMMSLAMDNVNVGPVRVDSESWKTFTLTIDVPRTDSYRLSIRFQNDYWDPKERKDRNLFIGTVVISHS